MIKHPSCDHIHTIKKQLSSGNLIAFPTETVYGIGADATNNHAIIKIFRIKRRPIINPLITHIHSFKEARCHGIFSKNSLKLASMFWPGPMTFIVKKKPSSNLSKFITSNEALIALRIPSNKIFFNILKKTLIPIAAPSANKSGYISPTSAHHVKESFNINVIDGGKCQKGLESTIIKANKNKIEILRTGAISNKDINIVCNTSQTNMRKKSMVLESPGLLMSHYSPISKLILNVKNHSNNCSFIGFGRNHTDKEFNFSVEGSLEETAINLFDLLRKADQKSQEYNYNTVCISPIPKIGIGITINNRLKKSAYRTLISKTKK
jgi:L-threonylcarbamoyladenylate synthase